MSLHLIQVIQEYTAIIYVSNIYTQQGYSPVHGVVSSSTLYQTASDAFNVVEATICVK